MMQGFDFCGFGTYGWLGMILSLVVIVSVIAGIFLLVVWLGRKAIQGVPENAASYHSPSAREVLQTRYVKGDISREKYLEMLDDLN